MRELVSTFPEEEKVLSDWYHSPDPAEWFKKHVADFPEGMPS